MFILIVLLVCVLCVELVVSEYDEADPILFIRCRPFLNSIYINQTTPELPSNSSAKESAVQSKSYFVLESVISNVKFKTTGFPNCTSHPKYLTNADDIWFRLKENKLELGLRPSLTFEPVWIKPPQQTYCLTQGPSYENESNIEELRGFVLILCDSDVQDYNTYFISRYVVGTTDLLNSIMASSIVVIYWIIRKTHNVVGWLLFCFGITSTLILGLDGTLTIVNARWIDVRRTTICVVLDTTIKYLYVVLGLSNFIPILHIFLTFWKMLFRIEAVDKSLDKLKIYMPIITLSPALVLVVDQICARIYTGFALVRQTHFAYAQCGLHETKFYEHFLTITAVLTLVIVVACGLVILRLKFSSEKLQTSSSQKQFAEMSKLFLKLLLGSSGPILLRYLVLFFFHKGHELSWGFTTMFCLTTAFNTLYYFFAFGVTKSNMRNLQIIMRANNRIGNLGPIANSPKERSIY